MGFEYVEVEQEKCQLWRWWNERPGGPVPSRSVRDCSIHAGHRLAGVEAKLATALEQPKGARAALSRHHAKANAAGADMFPDDARIE
jgi:hypothetical protein